MHPRMDVSQIKSMFDKITEIETNPGGKEAQEYYKKLAELEKNRLGDIDKAEDEVQPVDKLTEEEKDQILYDDYLKKGLVNIKNLVLKNPVHRTEKENEFLILYLKHQYEIFYDIEKSAVEMFIQRLSFDVYKPGETVAKTGQVC